MRIPPECIHIIAQSLIDSGFVAHVCKEDPYQLAAHYLDEKRLDEQIALIEQYHSLQGKFLEVGSGFGGLVTYLNVKRNNQCRAFGIEPAVDAYRGTMQCTRVLAAENNVRNSFTVGFGEALPFKSDTFDTVYATSVLEHVRDPKKVILESIRVLKPGGVLQYVIPNYGSWWEGHYGVIMLPHMPKFLFKFYVKLLGRDPRFVDTLQWIHKAMLKKILLKYKDNLEIISWGRSTYEYRLNSIDFSEWASLGKLKTWVMAIHKMGLVDWMIRLSRIFSWETPLILTLKKRKSFNLEETV